MTTDTALLFDIFLAGTNDSDLYRQRITPIISNLRRKIAEGTYDATLALKLWQYAADDMVRQYAADQMGLEATLSIVPKSDRILLAQDLAVHYVEEVVG
jgi:hypothetical protein